MSRQARARNRRLWHLAMRHKALKKVKGTVKRRGSRDR